MKRDLQTIIIERVTSLKNLDNSVIKTLYRHTHG